MSQITILSPEVAHKIAAGEVIERPASVVKELVENSIDAQATQITVEIQGGGIELIKVQDNGAGIVKEELKLAFQAHATSKISKAEDLFDLYTLGFRGEALPSIASVSKVTMYSKPVHQEHGFKIFQDHGAFVVEPAGTPPGTTVEVRDLFYNVPARLKFLKTPQTERRHVISVTTKLALGHPHVSFRLVVEGKTTLVTPGNGRLLDTVLLVEGKNITRSLIKVQEEFAWGKIWGYVGQPSIAKGNRSGQVFILNGRVIDNYNLRAAVEKAYGGLLPSRTFPWAILVLDLDPKLVDCNVHPAKAEVRFSNEQTIFTDVLHTVRTGLVSRNLAPSFEVAPTEKQASKRIKPLSQTTKAQLQWEPETWSFMDELLRAYKPSPSHDPKKQNIHLKTQTGVREEQTLFSKDIGPDNQLTQVRHELRHGRIIGQLQQTYILLEASSGLWILDQHIIQERILLERLKRDWEQKTIHIQELIIPPHLEFTAAEASLIQESLDQLKEFGIELEEFGVNSFLLRGIPHYLSIENTWKNEILQIAETRGKTTTWHIDTLATLACKGSVKAGDYLDQRVIRALLDDLAETENPFTCPHGRPIIVRLETSELLRRFGRT